MGSHGDFKTLEASRPAWEEDLNFHRTRTKKPEWKIGSGANDDSWKQHGTVEIDPYGEGRNSVDNYKLLISGIIPRPIGFLSTISADGKYNLAPFSYTQVVNHDPPIFCVGISSGRGNKKDSCQNLLDTKECTINVISEWFIEAANYTSIDAPYGVSEWGPTGLTQAPSTKVNAPRVAESAFSIEAKLLHHHEWESPSTGKKTGTLCILQGVNFHIREDALNEAKNMIDPDVLRPVSRLGGISYGRTTSGYELPRPDFKTESEKEEVKRLL
jgi:flavin reductase (DIM6/NTAB) family NADH-FMN oxidoreductase RutF